MAKVIILDTSTLTRDVVGRTLTDLAHEAHFIEPRSFFDIFKAVREYMPDLVIMDCHLAHCSADSLIRSFKEDPYLAGLKVLVFSTERDPAVAERMLARGADAFVLKGKIANLVDAVQDLTAGGR